MGNKRCAFPRATLAPYAVVVLPLAYLYIGLFVRVRHLVIRVEYITTGNLLSSPSAFHFYVVVSSETLNSGVVAVDDPGIEGDWFTRPIKPLQYGIPVPPPVIFWWIRLVEVDKSDSFQGGANELVHMFQVKVDEIVKVERLNHDVPQAALLSQQAFQLKHADTQGIQSKADPGIAGGSSLDEGFSVMGRGQMGAGFVARMQGRRRRCIQELVGGVENHGKLTGRDAHFPNELAELGRQTREGAEDCLRSGLVAS